MLRLRAVAIWIAALVLLGYILPRLAGSPLFDPPLMLVYAFLSIPLLSPMACDAISEGQPHLRTVALAALFGWTSSVLMMALRIWGANRALRAPRFLYPDPPILLSYSAIALAASVFGASLAALVAIHTRRTATAKRIMRTGFLLILFACVLIARNSSSSFIDSIAGQLTQSALPRFAVIVSLVLFAQAALFLVLAARNPRYASRFPSK